MDKQFSIIYDSWVNNEFEVHKSSGVIWYLMEYPHGLLYMYFNTYHMEAVLVTKVAHKNIITMLSTILVLTMSDLSKIILLDLACMYSSKLSKTVD